jgi:uncharacterized protein YegP (UPF0339 family)
MTADGPRREGDPDGGQVELYQDKSGKFRFRLKASHGEIIASGEAYESKASAKKGMESVQKNTAGATVVDLTEQRHGGVVHLVAGSSHVVLGGGLI